MKSLEKEKEILFTIIAEKYGFSVLNDIQKELTIRMR